MKKRNFLAYIIIAILLPIVFSSCYSNSHENYSEEDNIEENADHNSRSNFKFEDGTYSATVDYYNPETDYIQTYTLDVEVENFEVIQIDFPNGGWLDSDHISPAELDDDGNCTIYGEEGRTYEIHINE